jgi:hypothetical protein
MTGSWLGLARDARADWHELGTRWAVESDAQGRVMGIDDLSYPGLLARVAFGRIEAAKNSDHPPADAPRGQSGLPENWWRNVPWKAGAVGIMSQSMAPASFALTDIDLARIVRNPQRFEQINEQWNQRVLPRFLQHFRFNRLVSGGYEMVWTPLEQDEAASVQALRVVNLASLKGNLWVSLGRQAAELLLGEARHAVTSFAMLCAGTGITPIYQVLCAVLRDPNDLTAIHVIFANRREVDVLLKSELDMLAHAHPTRLHLHYILSQPADAAAWLAGDGGAATRSVGQVGGALVADKVPPHAAGRFALLCGPPGFLTQACDPALEALGYTKDARVYF